MPKRLHCSDLDQRPIYDFYIAARSSAVLAASLRLGLFETLEKQPKTLEQLMEELSISFRGMQAFLHSLLAMGLIEKQDDLFRNRPHTSAYLIEGREGYLGGLIEMEVENFLTPEKLILAAQEDRPTIYGDDDVWEKHQQDQEKAKKFTAAMHSISTKPALALANSPSLQSIFLEKTTLIDIGCGSGVYSIALLQQFPHLKSYLCDLPSLEKTTKKYIKNYGLENNAKFHGFDMFQNNWPQGDIVLFSQILHDWNYKQGELLLQKAYQALSKNGIVLIHEKLMEPPNYQPLANALVSLDMLVWTEGQQYSFSQLENTLQNVGFIRIRQEITTTYWSVVIAEKC